LYRALRSLNPSPHMHYYHRDFHAAGASPRNFARQERMASGQKADELAADGTSSPGS
jgi:hypothetical protein